MAELISHARGAGLAAVGAALMISTGMAGAALAQQAKQPAAAAPAQQQSAWVKLCEKAPYTKSGPDGKPQLDKDNKPVMEEKQLCLTHHEQMTNTGITMVYAAIQQLEGIDKLNMMVMVPPTTGIVMPAGMSVVVYNKEQVEKLEKKEQLDEKTLVGQKLMFTATYFETSDTKGTRNLAGLGPEQVYKSIWAALSTANVRAPDGRPAIDLVPAASVYTFNSVTKGYELEAIANPTRNWRLYFNLTQSKSEEKNLGSEAKSYYATYRDFWRQYDRVLLDGSGRLAAVADDGSGIVDTVGKGLKSIEDQILTMYTLAEGQRPPGQSPFKFSVRTAYSFQEGWLKGFNAGAGVRHQDGQVVDYRPATPSSAARVQFGRDNTLLDLNVRYSHPLRWLGQRTTWSVQLNINNALDQTKILPLRVSPTGAIVNYRFQTPREFVLTSKLGF